VLRKNSAKVFVLSALFIMLIASASAQDEDKWQGYFEITAKPGSDRSLAKGDLFLPIQQDENNLLFANIKTNFDDHSYKEGNVGLGVRKLHENWVVGGWTFYDWKESSTGNSFDQLTVGGELLSNDWDLRANAYIAENKVKDSDRASVIELNGNQIQARLGEERALSGVDFEIGKKLPYLDDSRFYIGVYHYDASGFEKVTGPKLRLEMRFDDLPLFSSISNESSITIGAEYTEDSVRGSESFGVVSLRIPFGKSRTSKKRSLSALEKRMVETVKRDDDIITNERQGDTLMPLLNPKTGHVINVVETVNANTSNVAADITGAGENSLIIADGSEGKIELAGSTINTQSGQILVGGGQQLIVQAQKPNGDLVDMVYTPAGSRANIERTGSGELIYVNNDDDVTISGINLSGGRPIRINNSQNVCVVDTNIESSAFNRQGVLVHNNSSVNFKDIGISNTGRQGLLVTSGSTVQVANLDVINSAYEGVYLSGNVTAKLRDATISNTGREGLRIRTGSEVSANNLNIRKTGSEAIELYDSTLSLNKAVISDIDVNANRDGIYAYGGSTLNADDLLIDNVTSQGIVSNNSTVNLSRAIIRNVVHQGLYAYNNSSMRLNKVSIDDAGRQGIYSRDSVLNITDTNINNAGSQGAYLYRTTSELNNIDISNSARQGLYVNGGMFDFEDVTIKNSGQDGVVAVNTNFDGSNLSVHNSSSRGLYLGNSTSSLNNVLIDKTSSQGMLIRNSVATMEDITVRGAGTQGVYVYNGSNANLSNLNILDSGRQGIYTRGASINADNVNILNANSQGAYIHSTTANLNGIRIHNVGQQGIYLTNNSNANINNAVITSSDRTGFYVRDSDAVINNMSVSNITDRANQDGIFIYRNSNVTLNSVDINNVTGEGFQVQGTSTISPTVVATDLTVSTSGRYGIANTYGDLTLNNATVSNSTLDGVLVNRGNLSLNTARVTGSGRFGLYVLRSNAALQDLRVSDTNRDGVLVNLSTASIDNSTIRDIGNGDASDDAIQITNSTVSGVGNKIEGYIDSGVACRATGSNTGSIGFVASSITSCP